MKDLTKGNIYKTFFFFGLPLVLAGVLTQSYDLIDSSIAGKFLGERGLATISSISPLSIFISSMFWGFCVGFSVYIARLFSAQEYAKLKSAFYTCLLMIFILGVVIGGALILLFDPLANLLNIDPSIRKDAFVYFSIVNAGRGILVLGVLLVFTLNSMGVSGYTFYMSLLSGVLNVTGNIVSVIFLKMGVAGIALSTLLSTTVVNLLYLLKIRSCFKQLDNGGQKVNLKASYLKNALPYALPNMAQQGVMYIVTLLTSPLVNKMGIYATASYSVVSHIYNFIATVYQNSSRTVSTYSAQCVGSKQYDKIEKGVRVGLIQGIFFATPFILACVFFRQAVCGLFLKADASEITKQYSYDFCKLYLPFIYFNILNNLLHALYRGVKAMNHLFLMTLLGSVTKLLFSVFLISKMEMSGIYLSWAISWVLECIVTTILYFVGKWKPKEELQTA